ncbi:sensor histidine kinase [Actinomadura roseirufa]|uniref:sensor histidine kinase n=1 Tax=Actinomadura roseirufa TaxID=2094049 RepID=UPI0013F157A6|nr:histidine kinase [Actinomadura roseirufa]
MDDPEPAARLRRGHLVAVDAVAAAFLALADALASGNMLKDRADFAGPFTAACLVAVGLGATVAARRYRPVPALAAALALASAATAAGVLWGAFPEAALALYIVAVGRPRPPWIPFATAAVASLAIVAARESVPATVVWIAVTCAVMAGAWAAGVLVRGRRSDAAQLERQREQRIVVEERLRIARELHDVVTHGMGLIAVKAGVANHVAEVRPGEARDALRVIEATSRDALTEMRRLLGVLRQEPGLDPPRVAGLADLAARATEAGVRVELAVGDAAALPDAVQLAVYRIVQEAVTNVVKHAAPTRCRATVEIGVREVRIEVTDDGPGGAAGGGHGGGQGGGHGLVGMRERVAMYGGRFSAGPREGGGFTVTATLPFGDAA